MADSQASVGRTVRRLVLAVVLMFGFGFALVPLYDVFCEVTGINGKSAALLGGAPATSGPLDAAQSREVTVEFVANTNGNLPWDFRPTVPRMKVRVGEMAKTMYVAHNRADHSVVGQAIPSVAPGAAARHLHKLECFCFTEQTLAAHERKDMEVRFRVDPQLPDNVHTLTLSYTFFDLNKGMDGGSHAGHAPAAGS
ncbi:cytochrome c oxidase assembly protein [Immundisolibacter sp.]|uniref:cytochrome c oxidase assembly protein n=1 Tax=Immundisolibacter sp. TaxID=1934948 RepID=UPI000EBD5368|nr:cytochrome c oxidase assembly protein [Gammaproteobacteria bacterium]